MSQNLYIVQGATFMQSFRWQVDPLIYKPVTAVVNLAPLQMTVPGHELPQMWRVEALSFQGLTQINSTGLGKSSDYHYVTVIDTDTVEFNEVNATDMGVYTSGGILRFYTPQDLTGYEAELTIWDKVNGTVLRTMTSSLGGELFVDTVGYRIMAQIEVAETIALLWKKGVYALKMTEIATGIVTEIAQGSVKVEIE
jgi:hypothetical protein